MYTITLIPGDGIGPEVINSARRVIDAVCGNILWEEVMAGQCAIPDFGEPIPDTVIESIKRNKVALKGPLTNIVGKGFRSPNVTLRTKLDLYANIRHARHFEGVPTKWPGADLIVVRESTEDSYAGVEQMVGNDSAIAIKFITRQGSERVIRKAFEYARAWNRKKLTISVKANIMKMTDGLFLRTGQEVAKDYPDIQYDETIIDALCMHLVRKPEDYDVIVTENCYGDIVSDLAAGISGGLGLGHGVNMGEECAVFESVHGSAPKYTNMNKVNPTAMILSGVLMLRYLKETEAADRIENAVAKVLREGKALTYDLGGNASTSEMTDEIIRNL